MKVKFSRCTSSNLANVPQVDGQLIYTKDTCEVYLDVGNNRKKLSDVIEVANKSSVVSPIITKLYYETSTDTLYKAKIVENNNEEEIVWVDITGATVQYVDTNFLKKDNTTAYTPVDDYNPATKKYVDDNCIPYQPFPAGLDTSHTTSAFMTSIRALNLPAGSTYLGGVTLTDMPFNGNAEVEIYVYPNNVIYLTLRSANISPYMWECNSHTYRGWEAVGKAYTDNALTNYVQNTDYATSQKGGAIKIGNGSGTDILNGVIRANIYGYNVYPNVSDNAFIGKKTLENVINNSIILTGSSTPTTSTVGSRIGQLYLNTTDGKVYQLTSIDNTDPNNIVYTWQQIINNADLTSTIGNINTILDEINGVEV